MEKVFIAECKDYDYINVEVAVFRCLDAIEKIQITEFSGKKVLVKANLLMKKMPEEFTTTHPMVIEAIVRYMQKKGAIVTIGDSPGGLYTEKFLKPIYKATGMEAVAVRTGCSLNYDTGVVDIVNDKAARLKNMQLIKVVHDADFIISAAKLKTHGMMTYTGAVKNLFGVIPGLTKVDYHFKMNDVDNFAQHIVDICEYVNPFVSVIDAIEGMDGDGPSAGEKRQVGLVMAATNPYALDTTALKIIGISPAIVPTMRIAKERNIFSGDMADVEVGGVELSQIKIAPFKLPKSINANMVGAYVPKFVENFIMNNLRPKPVFNYDKCISCGDCKRACPAKIIDMSSGKPVPDLSKCIRCFCCHELCPQKAVDIKRNWLYSKIMK